MLRSAMICMVMVVLVFLSSSCAKLPDGTTEAQGMMAREDLPELDSIPLAWGKLVSVSNERAFENWVQLWFEDEAGTLRVVPYSVQNERFAGHAVVIRRK